jgi:hypothetical protein
VTVTFRLRLATQKGQAFERRCPVNLNLIKSLPVSTQDPQVKDVAIGHLPAAGLSVPVTFVS